MAGNPFTSAQAPAAMQMMAPDLAAQQTQLARQQALADMLRQEGSAPMGGTEVVNGFAVRKSPWESIAKLGQALAGSTMQARVDEKQLALAKAMQGRMGDAFDKMFGGGGAASSQPPSATMPVAQPQGAGAAQQDPAAQAPAGAEPVAAAAPAQMTQEQRIRNMAKANWMMGNTDLANKLIENISTMTNEQRNMNAMGQDPLLMGKLATAAARKSGIIELQPGTTALDLSNGQERFQPKVGEGITLNNGVASALPGYAGANAEIAGASAGAVSGAQAQNKLITVNTAGGPVMMTEAQAAQMAGGGTPQAGTHFDNPNGASLNFKGSPQATFDQLSKLPPGPDRDQAMAAFSQYANQPSGGAAPAAPGIKLRSPEQEAQLMADVKLRSEPKIAQKTQEYKDMADYGKTLDGHVSEAQALLQRIGESRDALTKFKAGGGAEARAKMASMAQAIPGMPPELVNKIAGGDLAAAQVFQKFAAQEALGTMKQALASDSGASAQGNRISMELFIKNNPHLDTAPDAIEKVFNFITKQAEQVRAQQQAYHEYKNDPKNDPSAFPGYWAGEAIKRGYVAPQIVTGAAKGSTPAPANVQALLDKYK